MLEIKVGFGERGCPFRYTSKVKGSTMHQFAIPSFIVKMFDGNGFQKLIPEYCT